MDCCKKAGQLLSQPEPCHDIHDTRAARQKPFAACRKRGAPLMDFSTLGWREATFAAVVILALYVGFALLRLIRPKHAPPPSPAPLDDAPLRGLQTEMLGVRAQLDSLQSALEALRGEVEQIKAARAVSPQYNDALALAQKGMRPEDIAETCGISIGEADLVCALARNRGEGKP